jgi:hypothetical protein
VGAIRADLAGSSAIDADAALACEAGDTVVGVITARIGPQASTDRLVASVGGIAAVQVVPARTTADDEASGDIPAPGGKTDRAGRAWGVRVTQQVPIRTRWTECARVAPRSATTAIPTSIVGNAAIVSGVCDRSIVVDDATVRIDAGVSPGAGGERGRSGLTTAGHRCSDQQNTSKE